MGRDWLDRRDAITCILLAALVARCVLLPLHIQYATEDARREAKPYEYCSLWKALPNDFGFYQCIGERVLEGKTIYKDYSITKDFNLGFVYPPVFPTILALVMSIFGFNYVAIKAISVVFILGAIYVTYLIGLKLFSRRTGNLAALLYGFFYTVVISSSMGNDDEISIFFSLLALYLLIADRLALSGLAAGLAFSTKANTALLALPMLYYIWRTRKNHVDIVKYCAVMALVTAAVVSPYFLREGISVINPFILKNSVGTGGLCIQNIARLTYGIPYHLIYMPGVLLRDYNINDPMNYYGTHPFNLLLKALEVPFMAVGFAIACLLMWRHRLKDPKLEVLRNTALLVVVELIFYRTVHDFYFMVFLPPALLIFTRKETRFDGENVLGLVITYFAAATYVFFWTEPYWKPPYEMIALLSSVVLAGIGAHLAFRGFSGKKHRILLLMAIISSYYQIMNAFPICLFHPLLAGYISLEKLRVSSYYGLFWVAAVATVYMLVILAKELAEVRE